jgi:hypothetical protein
MEKRMKTTLIKWIGPALVLGVLMAATAVTPRAAGAEVTDGSRVGGVLNWSGNVDDTIIVYVHRHDVRVETVHGKDPNGIGVQFTGRVGEAPGYVHLRAWNGRGDVRIVQQPTAANDFTAAVRIYDPQPGQSWYTFTLVWRELPQWGVHPW